METGREARRFDGHLSSVFSVAFSPDGKYMLTGSWDKTARLWDVKTGIEERRFEGHSDMVSSVTVSPIRCESHLSELPFYEIARLELLRPLREAAELSGGLP
ncbi:MAG: hypothetical protein WBV94_29085 [Blastocatellia bacterium]